MQLDIIPALFHFVQDERKAEKQWTTFLRTLSYLKIQSTLCKRARGDYRYMNTLDDAIMYACVCLYDMTDSHDNLQSLVGEWQTITINTYLPVTKARLTDYVSHIKVPLLPHSESGIKIARGNVIRYLKQLKILVNDL